MAAVSLGVPLVGLDLDSIPPPSPPTPSSRPKDPDRVGGGVDALEGFSFFSPFPSSPIIIGGEPVDPLFLLVV